MPGLADHGDCLGDQRLVLVIKLADVGFDAADEVAELADLLLARGDLVLGPLLQVGRGTHPLPVGQQLLEVGRNIVNSCGSGPQHLFGPPVR